MGQTEPFWTKEINVRLCTRFKYLDWLCLNNPSWIKWLCLLAPSPPFGKQFKYLDGLSLTSPNEEKMG